jgi:hypothetical protein
MRVAKDSKIANLNNGAYHFSRASYISAVCSSIFFSITKTFVDRWQLSRQIIFFQQVEAVGKKSSKVIPNLFVS